ncbi:MAG TPA: hypothetical protein VFL56_02900, partial [Solirubrobacterales bacterium]|nr:hypothetical protein [Solirubrobacterales bacterium]
MPPRGVKKGSKWARMYDQPGEGLLAVIGLLSRPCLPGSFDSGEPRSTSQIVASMKSMNWRYSDCQFSI